MRRPAAGRALLAAGALAQAACQAYRPVPLSAAPAAEAVRVELSAAGAERLAAALGPGVVAVEGRVAELTPDTVRVAVTGTLLGNGQAVEWRGERVALGTADVAGVRRRQRSVVRSVILGAALVGGAVAAAALVGAGGTEGRGGGGGGTPR